MSTSEQQTIYIGSRKSALALWQTHYVKGLLERLRPDITFEIGLADTVGDQVQDIPLAELGIARTPGLFTKTLEVDLLAGRTRMAVHSLKDMPTTLPNGLVLGAICEREAPEDAVILHPKHIAQGRKSLADLPPGSVIGSSSLRREALVMKYYPHLLLKNIRGNVQTRLSKLEDHDDYDAILLALAGVRRSELEHKVTEVLPPDMWPHGVSQGSVAVECREDDTEVREMLSQIEHEASAQRCRAERAVLNALEGGCQVAMGVHTKLDGEELTLTAMVLSRDGTVCIEESATGNRLEPESIGRTLAKKLLDQGAGPLVGPQTEKRPITYGSAETAGLTATAPMTTADPLALRH